MKIDGVFSGGGIKAYAFIGSLQSIYNHNLEFKRVAGTSAGAIMASFLASGYTLSEIEKSFKNLDLKLFLDAPVFNTVIHGMKWLSLSFPLRVSRADIIEVRL